MSKQSSVSKEKKTVHEINQLVFSYQKEIKRNSNLKEVVLAVKQCCRKGFAILNEKEKPTKQTPTKRERREISKWFYYYSKISRKYTKLDEWKWIRDSKLQYWNLDTGKVRYLLQQKNYGNQLMHGWLGARHDDLMWPKTAKETK